MSNLGEKMKGKVKENVGWAIGNEQMQAEGQARTTKADAQSTLDKNKPSQTHGQMESTKGAAKTKTGETLGNQQMQAEGKLRQTKGDAERKMDQ